MTIEYKKRLTGTTSSTYKDICESIEPFVPHRPEINITRVRPNRDNLAELINIVRENKNALVTCPKGGGGKSVLVTAVAVELEQTKQKLPFYSRCISTKTR